MGAAHHRWEAVSGTGPFTENITHFVNGNLDVKFVEPFGEKVSGLAVLVGQGQPLNSTCRGCADFRHLFETGPQPPAVDT